MPETSHRNHLPQPIKTRRMLVPSLLAAAATVMLSACGGGSGGTADQTISPQTQKPQTQKPQTQKPQTQKPQTQKPQTQKPQTQKPQTQKPQTQKPQTGTPDRTGDRYPLVLKDRLLDMQWSLFAPAERYTRAPFNISPEAHINMGDYHRKYRGKGIKIAVIDTGLDVNHEDLKGAVINTYSIATGGTDVSASSQHGTASTGIIAARANDRGIFGVASESSIIFIQHKKEMNEDEMVKLFEKAQEFGADIISCSWGSGKDSKTGKIGVSDKARAKIQELARTGRNGKGTVIVFAAGNSNKDIAALNLEANIPEVIAVGASSEQNVRANMSNFGSNLDVVAPGGNYGFSLGVPTLAPMGTVKGNTVTAKGTSAAAPLVSGVIALVLEKNPNLTRQEIESLLQTTSDKIGSTQYVDGHNPYYGYGKINVRKLLDAVPAG